MSGNSYQSATSSLRNAGRVEVTVQCLHGIAIRDGTSGAANQSTTKDAVPSKQQTDRFANVTATVTFSGSVPEMQVGSSSVCGVTGQLLVESAPIQKTSSAPDSTTFIARWSEQDFLHQPHLIMPLLPRDSSPAQKSFSASNRSTPVGKDQSSPHDVPNLDSSETSSTASTLESTQSKTTHGKHRRKTSSPSSKVMSSVPNVLPPLSPASSATLQSSHNSEVQPNATGTVWSASTSATNRMPEIIEMYIRLKLSDDGADHLYQGVAYLVVFGHRDDGGTYQMDLPVRRPAYLDEDAVDATAAIASDGSATTTSPPRLVLQPDARISVQVKIVPAPVGNDGKTDNLVSKTSDDTLDGKPRILYSHSMILDSQQLEPLMDKIRQHEKVAKEHWQLQRKAWDVHVPANQAAAGAAPSSEHDGCLGGSWVWSRILSALAEVMGQCDGGHAAAVRGPLGLAVPASDSMTSTIATRESLNI